MSKKCPGENNLSTIFQLIEDKVNSLKELIRSSKDEATEFFYVPFTFGAGGFELDNMTFAEIVAAYNAGKRIVGRGYVPEQAGLGFSGNFELPLSYLAGNGAFVLTLVSGQTTCEAWINSNGAIASNVYVLAVANDLGGKKIVYSSSAPTTNDTSVMTIVL